MSHFQPSYSLWTANVEGSAELGPRHVEYCPGGREEVKWGPPFVLEQGARAALFQRRYLLVEKGRPPAQRRTVKEAQPEYNVALVGTNGLFRDNLGSSVRREGQ